MVLIFVYIVVNIFVLTNSAKADDSIYAISGKPVTGFKEKTINLKLPYKSFSCRDFEEDLEYDVMSKKNKQMDKHFQVWNVKQIFKIDTIDYFSLIDSQLFFPENLINIKKQIGWSKYESY